MTDFDKDKPLAALNDAPKLTGANVIARLMMTYESLGVNPRVAAALVQDHADLAREAIDVEKVVRAVEAAVGSLVVSQIQNQLAKVHQSTATPTKHRLMQFADGSTFDDLFAELETYFDDRADDDVVDGVQVPNLEMRLLVKLRELKR